MTTMWRMAQRGAGRGIGQPALDRPQDSQRESLVRYFRGGAVGQRQGRGAAVPAPNTFSQEWANYIAARIKRAETTRSGSRWRPLARFWPRNATSCAPSSGAS